MKKTAIISIILMVALAACKNFDIEHPDFDYTSGYFPYQFPVRTLVLGDYIYDNSNDNNHKFIISIGIGGVYSNEKDRTFNIQVDNSLCDNVLFSSGGDPIIAMPQNYYQLSSNQIVPKGKVNGGVEVQLSDAFFNDPKAIKNTYVVPLRITGSNDVDTILVGQSANPNPDPRVSGDWTIAPKDFTMFAVKYINEYDGKYFRYGKSKVKNPPVPLSKNRAMMIRKVRGEIPDSTTVNLERVLGNRVPSSVEGNGNLNLVLTFSGNSCTVSPRFAPYTISGTGTVQSKKSTNETRKDGIVFELPSIGWNRL